MQRKANNTVTDDEGVFILQPPEENDAHRLQPLQENDAHRIKDLDELPGIHCEECSVACVLEAYNDQGRMKTTTQKKSSNRAV